MHFIRTIISIIIISFFLASCDRPDELERERMVLLYLDGNNNLSSFVQQNIDSLLEGYLPSDGLYSDALLVYTHKSDNIPTLMSYARDAEGNVVQQIVSVYDRKSVSTDAQMMSRVISDARLTYPAKKYGLVLWSHGSGWLPENYHGNPTDLSNQHNYIKPEEDFYSVKSDDVLKSFGVDSFDGGSTEMDIRTLASVLTDDYEFIIFDCCLMSCIEVAYELRHDCEYMIASPTEIMTKGFPYSSMMDPIFNQQDREEAMRQVCKLYYDYYDTDQSQPWGAVTLARTAALEPLALICRNIFAAHRDDIAAVNTYAIQQYDRNLRCWFNDMNQFVATIANDQEYSSFKKAFDDVVICQYSTEKFISIYLKNCSGMSIYIPNPRYVNLNEMYKTLAWNKATALVE